MGRAVGFDGATMGLGTNRPSPAQGGRVVSCRGLVDRKPQGLSL